MYNSKMTTSVVLDLQKYLSASPTTTTTLIYIFNLGTKLEIFGEKDQSIKSIPVFIWQSIYRPQKGLGGI